MNKKPPTSPNPALEQLNILVGDWAMELSNAPFLPSPADVVRGQASFDWLENGAFLVMYMGNKPRGTPDAIWLISRDESKPGYVAFYFDARKVSRVYEMSFSDRTWKLWRNSPGFSQRFEASISQDGNVISGQWEKSSDGSVWEHDFDVRYTKAG